jgi:nitric oxide dioxygenase
MLSQASRPYIAASVPVLREHGVAITTVFYRNMFNEHPELKNLFNMGNQAQGTQQQSLAAAVFAYAANIDNPSVLQPVISRIVHKHVSLGIKPEQYSIVGAHLLGAIKEVLGDAATPELIDAWAEAYWLLADVLIAEEKALYEKANVAAGELREMQVIRVSQESELVKSFTLIPADGNPLLDFEPGQYISVAVDFPDGRRQLRQYSLSEAPGLPYYRISVKREPGGEERPLGQVSNWLHENIRVKDKLLVSAPFGDFNPDIVSDTPLVLLSAGVGITPMISVLNHLSQTQPKRQVIFAHATHSASRHSHVADIEAAKAAMPNLQTITFYEDQPLTDAANRNVRGGRMQIEQLPAWNREQTKVYLCGPVAFMRKQWQELLAAGVPEHLLHREVFGPDLLDKVA